MKHSPIRFGLSAGILIVLAMVSASRLVAQDFDFKKLSFMAGCWEAQTGKDLSVIENWTALSDNMMLATTLYLEKGKGKSFEFTKVEKTDSGLVFVATTEFKDPTEYRMTTLTDEFAVWENRGKEFPQRIMYRLASDGALIVRNDLIEGYDSRNVEVRLKPMRCPGKGKDR